MKKTIIKRKIRIKAPTQKVWDALADFGNISRMSADVSKSYLTSDQKTGVGTTRHCDLTRMGAQVEERIIEWDEGKSMKIDIYANKRIPMTAGMIGFFSLKKDGNETILSGNFEYSMSNFIGDIMNSLIMRKMNINSWEKLIAGIKYHVETGRDVGEKTKLDMSPVEK